MQQMAQFNLDEYATVEERLVAFMTDHPDARIVTKNITTLQDRQVSTWVVQTEIWLPITDFQFIASDAESFAGSVKSPSELWVLKSTGLAFEVDGQGMANKTSALENAETSSVGRALMLAGYSGNKKGKGLASRSEMEKVARGVTPTPVPVATVEEINNIADHVQMATTKAQLRDLWTQHASILESSVVLPTGKITLKALIMARQAEVE